MVRAVALESASFRPLLPGPSTEQLVSKMKTGRYQRPDIGRAPIVDDRDLDGTIPLSSRLVLGALSTLGWVESKWVFSGSRPAHACEAQASFSLKRDWDELHEALDGLRYDYMYGRFGGLFSMTARREGGEKAYEKAIAALWRSVEHTSQLPNGGSRALWDIALRNLAALEEVLLLNQRNHRPVGELTLPPELIETIAAKYRASR
jgi:hypothetical protein